jgi:RNA polymerase sigma-70 factor (ECF subfamily)
MPQLASRTEPDCSSINSCDGLRGTSNFISQSSAVAWPCIGANLFSLRLRRVPAQPYMRQHYPQAMNDHSLLCTIERSAGVSDVTPDSQEYFVKVNVESSKRELSPLEKTRCSRAVVDAPTISLNDKVTEPCLLTISDDQLLSAAQGGEDRAFEELCRRHSSRARKAIVQIVRDRDDADDALQDTLLRAFTHIAAFRRSCKFSTWLTTIATNAALMVLRKRRNAKEISPVVKNKLDNSFESLEFADHALGPEGLHSKHQLILLMQREVKKLRPQIRSVIEHYYGSECSVEESAKALSISVAAAKSRLLRGRRALRRSFDRRGVFYTDF